MIIKHWPDGEKPREKLLERGVGSLSEAELLAIFLRTGIKGKTAVDLARELLLHFGGLKRVFGANQNEFCQIKGLGLTKYIEMQAIIELAKRYLVEYSKSDQVLKTSAQTKQFVLAKLGRNEQEVFGCLFLNNKNHLLAFKELFYGSINRMEIYPREIARAAMTYNAVSVICAHNHPSGDSSPSDADVRVTKQLRSALELIDIRLLDHIVVGGNQAISLAESGFL